MKSMLEVKPCRFGRGVFAAKRYREGEIIEISPVIVLSKSDREAIDSTALYDYYYSWGADDDQAAIALGFGSLFNHSYVPNARYLKRFELTELHFVARRTIDKGEEILVNYNGDPSSMKPLWFEVQPSRDETK